jgi:hypothetical protein
MTSSDWWPVFLKHTKAAKKTERQTSDFSKRLDDTLRLYHLLIDKPGELGSVDSQDMNSWLTSAEEFVKDVKQREFETGNPSKRAFYGSFYKAASQGLEAATSYTATIKSPNMDDTETAPAEKGSLGVTPGKTKAERPIDDYAARKFGKTLTELKRRYTEIMEARHEEKKNKGLKDTAADEADRLKGFLQVAATWLQNLQALEYAFDVLDRNLKLDQYPIDKQPLPLQFRMEQGYSPLIFRLVRASYRKPYPEDISILDVINECYSIPMFLKEGKQLVDDPEVIRFLRLHSEENKLMHFKGDSLSQVAKQMYQALVSTINTIKKSFEAVVTGINQSPIHDLEFAFADINPDECRSLLRKKFQSLLPIINERHYREETKKKDVEQSTRTRETAEDFQRDFQHLKEELFGNLKTTMATSYWLRRMLISSLRNNFSLEKKQKSEKPTEETGGEEMSQMDLSTHLVVGTSITIGDEDIGTFYINPDDIITSEMALQRVDRTDKWIAVRKSEKTHRILKKDFFGVIKSFLEKDLNPALEEYGFRTIDLNKQLLPEVHERLADEARIDAIRSAVLGTVITNLEEFKESRDFHNTLKRYFKKPDYDNIHYPTTEKMALVARGLVPSKTSILQMKYRRVLRVRKEIDEHLQQLTNVIENEPMSRQQAEDFREDQKYTGSLVKVLKKVQQIMIYARPSLVDVKMEAESDAGV